MATPAAGPGPIVGMLDLLKLHTPDVEGTVAFYRDVLGAVVAEEAPPHWARVRLANVDLGLHLGRAASPVIEAGCEPGFRAHDVAAWRAHLVRHGVPLARDLHDVPGGVALTFRDPAGNALSLIQYGTTVAAIEAGDAR